MLGCIRIRSRLRRDECLCHSRIPSLCYLVYLSYACLGCEELVGCLTALLHTCLLHLYINGEVYLGFDVVVTEKRLWRV